MDLSLDKEDMYSVISKFYKQIEEGWELGEKIAFKDVDRIIIAGMGGSALPGEILKSYLNEIKLPITINKNYELPAYIDGQTLVFIISYSGNTEETIEALKEANRKGCKIVIITSGGKLEELSSKLNKKIVKVPGKLQPRFGYGYMFFPLLRILQNSKVIKSQDTDIKNLIVALQKDIYKKKASEISEKLVGKIPIIYSSERMYGVAYKWKINFNENSKIHAFCNYFPELNHNELVGYTKINGDYYVLMLKDDYDHPRIKKRMDITKKIIQKSKIPVLDIELSGGSDLVRIFSLIHLGDWVAYFLALRNKVDPTPVELVEDLKKELQK